MVEGKIGGLWIEAPRGRDVEKKQDVENFRRRRKMGEWAERDEVIRGEEKSGSSR